jgi:hypothetical protein
MSLILFIYTYLKPSKKLPLTSGRKSVVTLIANFLKKKLMSITITTILKGKK